MEIKFGGAPKLNCIQLSPFEAEDEKLEVSFPDSSLSLREEIQSNRDENLIIDDKNNKQQFENQKYDGKIPENVALDDQSERRIKLISIFEEKKSRESSLKGKKLNLLIETDLLNNETITINKKHFNERHSINKSDKKFSKLSSSLFQMIFSKDVSLFAKLKYVLIKMILAHVIVIFLTIVKIIYQNSIAKNCWMAPICTCSDDFQSKLYFSLLYIFFFWNLIIVALAKIAVEIVFHSPLHKFMVFSLYWGASVIVVYFSLLTVDESNYSALPLMSTLTVFSSLFHFKNLIGLKHFCLKWFQDFVKINGCIYLDLLHYALCKRLLLTFNDSLLNSFGPKTALNLVKIYQILYFTAYTLIFKKLTQLYYNYIVVEKKHDCSSSIILVRLSLVFVISVPLTSLINMNLDDWGGWLMVASYVHFLISFYCRKNIFMFFIDRVQNIWNTVYYKGKKEKVSESKIKNENDCELMISGCLLDIVLIANSRLLILFISNRWFSHPNNIGFYKNCSFEIDNNKFKISSVGIILIIIINVLTTSIVVFYAFWKKNIIFEYKTLRSNLMNIYLIFLLHGQLEALIQTFTEIN